MAETNGEKRGSVYTYARVSKDDRETGSCSLEWQRGVLEAYMDAHGIMACSSCEDNGVTAAIPLDERPEGKRLVDGADMAGDIIVTAKFDRIFRDVEDFRLRLRVWCEKGVKLVCVQEGIDLTTATGRMIATMIVAVAEWERETIGDRTRAAIGQRKSEGRRYTAEARYGWRHVPYGPARSDGTQDSRLEPCPAEQKIIVWMEAQRNGCTSLADIAGELNHLKVPTRRGGPWSKATVQKILENIDTYKVPPLTKANRPPCADCGYMNCCCPLERDK